MLNIYIQLIKKGKITIEQVPIQWKEQVQNFLKEENKITYYTIVKDN